VLDLRDPVLDEEGALADHPQRLARPQRRCQLGLGAAEAEARAQQLALVGRLAVDHLGVGVADQPLGDSRLA
jgi:hypothetical protein